MKKNIKNTARFLLVSALLPLAGFAQNSQSQEKNDQKFTYGAPAYWRPYNQRTIGFFETTKKDADKKYEGMKIRFGAGFTQQFQNLKHKNPDALFNTGNGANRLYPLKAGFMTAQANFMIDAQLADGIQLNVTNYMSSRHHNEWWVKGGFIQFDKLPFNGDFWQNIMKVTTIKIGHFEINYGDAHFRRPDGGATIQSPFMEGNIMDAFATEIGGEIYVQKNGLFGMMGITNGMLKGNIDSTWVVKDPAGNVIDDNTKRNPSLYWKAGIDKQVTDKIRVRFTGSYYTNSSQAGSGLTLYSGDRTGSNYQDIMEKGIPSALPASTTMIGSGRFNPGFSKKLNTYMLNSFIKVCGAEFFGTYESAKGRAKNEVAERKADQYAVEALYRFGKNESLYAGGRYNLVKAELLNVTDKVKVNRVALAAGWFLTSNVLLKGEYVIQKYVGFPNTDYRAGGKFNGYVIEAVVGF